MRYRVVRSNGEESEIESPAALPEGTDIDHIEEPMILATIHVPQDHVGAVMALCQDRRGRPEGHGGPREPRPAALRAAPGRGRGSTSTTRSRASTRGYGSYDYELCGYERADLVVKLDVLVNGDPVDALSLIVHRDKAYQPGQRADTEAQGVHSAPDVRGGDPGGHRRPGSSPGPPSSALRKNVTAKCYGGDITRKRKLLEKQKEGKRRMKQVGSVEIPQEAFLAALRLEGD